MYSKIKKQVLGKDERQRDFDFLVFGASGFTGFKVAEYLASVQKQGGLDHKGTSHNNSLTWAVAGRSEQKLKDVLKKIEQNTGQDTSKVGVIVADVKDEKSMVDMCSRSRILLNCTGPYRFFGESVVKACLASSADYLDITGEPEFAERMMVKYHEEANEKGIFIIHYCGFDSIPADLGSLQVERFFKEKYPNGVLSQLEVYLTLRTVDNQSIVGHYTTYEALVHSFANVGELRALRKDLRHTQKQWTGGFEPARVGPKPIPTSYFFNHRLQRWCIPFMGADSSVVNNTQYFDVFRSLFRQQQAKENKNEDPVAADVPVRPHFSMYATIGSFTWLIFMAIFGLIFKTLVKFSFGRTLLLAFPGLFSFGAFSHAGPTAKQMDSTFVTLDFSAMGYSDKNGTKDDNGGWLPPDAKITATLTGPEPGYILTSMLLVETAIFFHDNRSKLDVGFSGGVFTPGSVFGDRVDELLSRFPLVKMYVNKDAYKHLPQATSP